MFSPILHYIKGPCNILANNLSRLIAKIAEGKKLVEPAEVSNEEKDEAYFLDLEYSGLYDDDIWECTSLDSILVPQKINNTFKP